MSVCISPNNQKALVERDRGEEEDRGEDGLEGERQRRSNRVSEAAFILPNGRNPGNQGNRFRTVCVLYSLDVSLRRV